MLRAYFDTTVPSWIVDGLVPAEDVAALKAAFMRGDLIAPIGPVILDELVGELEKDRDAMIRKLKLLRDFGTFHGMLKQPADILREAIQTYAEGREPPTVTLPEDQRRALVRVLADVIAGSRRYEASLTEVFGGVTELKLGWLIHRQEAHQGTQSYEPWQRVRSEVSSRSVPFPVSFARGAVDFALAGAEPLGLADACRQRGVEGLISLPVIRLAAGVSLAQMYAELVGSQGQPRKPDRKDGYDLWHAILASTANLFVTFDKRLADHVERIPDLQTPRIVRSIKELLGIVRRVSGISSDTN
jgi:hypothetical protein